MKAPRHQFLLLCLLVGVFFAGCVTPTKGPDQAFKAGNWKEAYDGYEQVSATLSGASKKKVEATLAGLRNKITATSVATAERLAGPNTIPDLEAATQSLNGELRYDNAAKSAQKKLDELSARLASMTAQRETTLTAAAAAERAGQWTVAYESLALAQRLNPSVDLAPRVSKLIGDRDTKAPLEIEQKIAQENLQAAEQAISQYLAERPRPAANITGPLEARINTLRKKMLESQLDELLAAKRYYPAYHLILASKRDYLQQRLSQIRKDGAQYYFAKARADFSPENMLRIGYAYFAIEKAWELLLGGDDERSDLNNEIFVLRRDISDTVDSLIKHQIAVITFSSPSVEAQGGVALANALVQNLTESVPYGIEILERQKIENVEKETGTNGAAKVRMFIVGDLTTMNVERKQSEREGTVSARIGKRQVPNPQFSENVRLFGKDSSKWPSALKSTPPTMDEYETAVVKYKLGQETLNGVMVASVRAFETAGTVKWAKDFKAEHNKTDSFSDPVPIAVDPIPLDALELPTDNEVKELLRKELAQKIGAEVIKSFEHREQRYLDSAKASLLRREMPQAVADLAAGYFYAHKDVRAIPDPLLNPAVSELRQLGFFDCTEIP